MKKLQYFFVLVLASLFFQSCIENEPQVWKGAMVEFDATVWNNPALGVKYPLLTRVPGYGRPVESTDPSINRLSGTIKVRVNFISAHSDQDQVIAVAATSASTAVAGTHYNLPSTLTIPANSSFGELSIEILNPGAGTGPVSLVLELQGNEKVKPSENYKNLGISIAQ